MRIFFHLIQVIAIIKFMRINCEVLGVVELFRHGARTPLRYFDHVKNLFYPYNEGELTIKGIQQLRHIGKYMKDKYKSFIFKNNKPLTTYKILSLDTPRCIKSAINHFQTLFEDNLVSFSVDYLEMNGKQILISNCCNNNFLDFNEYIRIKNEDSNYELEEESKSFNKIKIELLNVKNNTLLGPREYFKLRKKFIKVSPYATEDDKIAFLNLNNTNSFFLEEIIRNNYSILTIKNIWDTIQSTKFHYPGYNFGIAQNILDIFDKYKMIYNYLHLSSDDNQKLLSSNFFELLIIMFDDLTQKRNDKQNTNLLFLSGRDVNIVDIINNIVDPEYIFQNIIHNYKDEKIKEFFLPPFASILIFELNEYKKNEFYVKIVYNGRENFKNLRKVLDKSGQLQKDIKYELDKGIKYNEFKDLLLSRININYKFIHCK